jgi:serine/threonine protein kinase
MSADNLIGQTIFGEYTITKKLGEGGMGSVYLAEQQSIDQQIAIKVLHGRAAKNDEMVKRFNREAKAISMLSHPNIIRVFIFGRTDDGLIYLAMEFVKGQSLRQAISKGPFAEMRAIKIVKQALSALSESHSLGIIHRDLKPDNILLTTYRGQEDFVKVLDFGIAKVKDPDGTPEQKLTQAGVVYGTPEYLSPEQAQALELFPTTDIYSMGCILYELMTGRVPFKASTAVQILMMHVHQQPDRPSAAGVSPEMERIILKSMAKLPQDRYQSATEFLNALSAREQQLVASGYKADVLRMPGQDATMAVVMPDDIRELAKAAMHQASSNPRDQATVASPALPSQPTSGPPKGMLLVIVALLVILLIVVIVLIAVMKMRG